MFYLVLIKLTFMTQKCVIFLLAVLGHHTAVTDLDCITIKDFPKFVVFREVLVYKGKEFVSDIGADIFAEWQLYQSLLFHCLFFHFVSCWWFIMQIVPVSTFFKCFLIWIEWWLD